MIRRPLAGQKRFTRTSNWTGTLTLLTLTAGGSLFDAVCIRYTFEYSSLTALSDPQCCNAFEVRNGGIFNDLYIAVVGKMRNCGMRNAESIMRNRKCGMTLIGQTVKPRDRCHSAYYRKSAMTSQIGRTVKCGMRKMHTMKQDCVVDRAHTL